MRRGDVTAENESIFLDNLNEIMNIVGRNTVRMTVLERLVRIRPEDADTAFETAYLYSNNELHDLCFMHYDRRNANVKSAYEWNNLGVVSALLGLKVKSIESYKNATEKGNSLAAANLAYRLLNQGFLQEGIVILEKARTFETLHPNVYEALSSVDTRREEEDKKAEEIVKKARQASNFASEVGSALSRPKVKLLNENWLGPTCALALRKDKIFSMYGESKEKAGLASSIDRSIQTRYEGFWEGSAIFGKVKRAPIKQSPPSAGGLLTSALGMMSDVPIEGDFIGCLCADNKTFMISERKGTCFSEPYKIVASEPVSGAAE